MRKFIVRVVVALVVLCGASFYVYKAGNVSETYENNETKKVNNNMLSMMLETSAGSGAYQQTTASAWPTEGYVFNENLSRCEQGSSLSWDNVNKKVIMEGSSADKCYVYFDKTITLVDYVKAQYAGTQGENNLYYHDSTLENGAGDNSYRYAGSSDTTNNFVCFGYDSTDGSCPTDNLYRIIGVFDNQVKLIKYDYANSNLLGTNGEYSQSSDLTQLSIPQYKGTLNIIDLYHWHYDGGRSNTSEWVATPLNEINLNQNFLINIDGTWANKISVVKWNAGGNMMNNVANVTSKISYQNEILTPTTNRVYDVKIGLMYVSDYGYAASSTNWKKNLSSYSSAINTNWMYMGLEEWTICPEWSTSSYVFIISSSGAINFTNVTRDNPVRPTFYLNYDVTYVSGNGTKNEPFIIN